MEYNIITGTMPSIEEIAENIGESVEKVNKAKKSAELYKFFLRAQNQAESRYQPLKPEVPEADNEPNPTNTPNKRELTQLILKFYCQPSVNYTLSIII